MENTHSPQPQSTLRAPGEDQREQFRLRRVQALTALLDTRRTSAA